MSGQLFVISGPSGAGKTTLLRAAQKTRPDLVESVSTTTRTPRPGEVEGYDYHFVDREEFLAGVKRGDFLEWAEVHGNLYGTDASRIAAEIDRGKQVALIIDVEGERQVKAKIPEARTIFILPPSRESLIERLSGRGSEDTESLSLRLQNAEHEIACATRYEFIIVNDDFPRAVGELDAIIESCAIDEPTQQTLAR